MPLAPRQGPRWTPRPPTVADHPRPDHRRRHRVPPRRPTLRTRPKPATPTHHKRQHSRPGLAALPRTTEHNRIDPHYTSFKSCAPIFSTGHSFRTRFAAVETDTNLGQNSLRIRRRCRAEHIGRFAKTTRAGEVSSMDECARAQIERCGVGAVTGTATTLTGRFRAPSRAGRSGRPPCGGASCLIGVAVVSTLLVDRRPYRSGSGSSPRPRPARVTVGLRGNLCTLGLDVSSSISPIVLGA